MTDNSQPDLAAIRQGMAKIRKCRWFLWTTIMIYVPGLLLALQMNFSSSALTKLFGAWVLLLCVAVGLATIAKCPRCRNNFHTNGPTFLPVRKCVHCGLHVNADKYGGAAITSGNSQV